MVAARPPITAGRSSRSDPELGGGGTAIGEAVFSSLDQVAADDRRRRRRTVPARIVLLSDGTNTAGRSPDAAAEAAARPACRSRPSPTARRTAPSQGGTRCRSTRRRCAQLADATGGTAYTAESGEELRDVYDDIGSSIGWRTEQREVTPYLAALALLIGVGAGALSLRWFSRLI